MTNEQDDLKSRQAAESDAAHLTMHDTLTGLPNLGLFADRLMMAISLAKRNDWMLAVMLIRVDETRRPGAGGEGGIDEPVLQAVAARLSSRARSGDTVSRMADDGLLYLLVNPGSRENVRRVTQKVRDRLLQPLVIDAREQVVTPRIGIAVYPDDGVGVDILMSHAQTAMRLAAKRNLSYMFFEADDESGTYTGEDGSPAPS